MLMAAGLSNVEYIGGPRDAVPYRVLDGLGARPGMLGVIFKNAGNDIRNPALLKLFWLKDKSLTDMGALPPYGSRRVTHQLRRDKVQFKTIGRKRVRRVID